MTKNPIARYLKANKITQTKLCHLLEELGWKPSRSSLSRWVSGERRPTMAAQAFLKKLGIVYP